MPRRTKLAWVLIGVASVVVGSIASAAVITVPYYAIAPGSARPTTPLIRVDGSETYPASGTVLFATVRVDHVSLLEAFTGWLDPNIDVWSEDEYLGDQSNEQNRQQNLALMQESKDEAVEVALRKLGYEVTVSGTGALITDVQKGAPADAVLAPGDTVIAVDGTPITRSDELVAAIGARKPGDTVTLTIQPPDRIGERTAPVTLASRADDAAVAFLGVGSATRDRTIDGPVNVFIDSGRVGGPSAGLAFTLSVIDLLTPGELTGGTAVAVTGTIRADGSVGPVGGVVQKVQAVKGSGAEIFLVPTAEFEEAKAHAGRNLRVEAVGTLDDALRILASFGGNGLALAAPGTGGT